MNIDIGNDIIEIARIRYAIEKHGENFFKKICTEKELKYCLQHKYKASIIAGRFAAKEAIAKALKTGISTMLSWKDMEILNDDAGVPIVKLSQKSMHFFPNCVIKVSISHCQNYATAVALVIKNR